MGGLPSRYDVVAIVGCAGGLPTLRSNIRALPRTISVRIVIFQHLASDRASRLAGILTRDTSLAVAAVAADLVSLAGALGTAIKMLLTATGAAEHSIGIPRPV
jgi:chemotaxis response regulator CheB